MAVRMKVLSLVVLVAGLARVASAAEPCPGTDCEPIGWFTDHNLCSCTPEPPAPEPVAAAPAPPVFVVGYHTNHACLAHATRLGLDQAVAYLKANPERTAVVRGYTDTSGSLERNMYLAKRRALVAMRYMVKRGIAPTRLRHEGHGSHNPIASNDTAEGRAKNRRVEVVVE